MLTGTRSATIQSDEDRIFEALSNYVTNALAVTPEGGIITVRADGVVAFASGGPAHVEALGLLLAGVSVTAGLNRLLPRWMMGSGLVLAAMAELSCLSLVLPAASYLLPLVRFPAFVWLVAAGALLPDRRKGAREPSPLPGLAPTTSGLVPKPGGST